MNINKWLIFTKKQVQVACYILKDLMNPTDQNYTPQQGANNNIADGRGKSS